MARQGLVRAACALAVCAFAFPGAAEAAQRVGPLAFDVLTPPAYSATSGRHWPVLYLVPGSGEDGASAVEKLGLGNWSGRKDAVVVLVWEIGYGGAPDGLGWNFLTDFPDGSKPEDTAFATTLVPWIDGHYRTRARRRYRAIAGYSAGGYAAPAIASRHPGMFGAVGAFSGLVDLWDRYPVGAGILLAPMLLDGPESDALQRWGNPVTDAANWHAQNPTDLAARLRGTRVVYIAGGNGVPSDAQEAQDDAGPGLGPQALVEQEVGAMTANYDKALTAAGVVHVYRPHAGLHDPRHWRDDLAAFWSRVRAAWRR